MYYDHQLQKGQIEEDGFPWGGLYWRHTLSNYFPQSDQDNSWIPNRGPFQEPEPWHGAPMAAMWRAFFILGSPMCGIPDEEVRLLRNLQDLYKRKIHLSTVSGSSNRGNGEHDNEDHTRVRRSGIVAQELHASPQF